MLKHNFNNFHSGGHGWPDSEISRSSRSDLAHGVLALAF